MKKRFLFSIIVLFYAAFLSAQSISSYSLIITGSVMKPKAGVGYSLTQPMYHELVQTQSSERTIIDELGAQEKVNIYPNPFTEMVTVNINAKENGKLKIELYNIIGAKVMQDKTFLYFSGISEKQIDLSELPNGMYFLKTTYKEESETKKLLIKLLKE